jgi:hypothetical protein
MGNIAFVVICVLKRYPCDYCCRDRRFSTLFDLIEPQREVQSSSIDMTCLCWGEPSNMQKIMYTLNCSKSQAFKHWLSEHNNNSEIGPKFSRMGYSRLGTLPTHESTCRYNLFITKGSSQWLSRWAYIPIIVYKAKILEIASPTEIAITIHPTSAPLHTMD